MSRHIHSDEWVPRGVAALEPKAGDAVRDTESALVVAAATANLAGFGQGPFTRNLAIGTDEIDGELEFPLDSATASDLSTIVVTIGSSIRPLAGGARIFMPL